MATSAFAEDKTKVGFVYVGPVGDGGWTYQHDLARQAVEAEFGDRVETTFIESVPEGADAERIGQPPNARPAQPAQHQGARCADAPTAGD